MSAFRVFKFGGASVKSADGVRNLLSIIKMHSNNKLVVVVSAMGKTTNALESILAERINANLELCALKIDELKNYHLRIVNDLWQNTDNTFILSELDRLFAQMSDTLSSISSKTDYDYSYDQIVSFGELISTTIVSNYLICNSLQNI